MPEQKTTIEHIFDCASEAEAMTDEAFLHSELPGDHPIMIALSGAHSALQRIRLAAELDQVPKMDPGAL